MQQVSDPYRALGVARGATEAEIKAAHSKLVKRYHPDTGSKQETERFLRVQEAARVLSDPLLRKEWDFKHAPGPVRAAPEPAPRPQTRRRSAAPPKPAEQRGTPPSPPRQAADSQDPRRSPRSAHAYTWSASEVPWWEEGVNRTEKRPPGRRRQREAERTDNPQERPSGESPLGAQQDFEVYNRSSGAAWSMAARAYFRKGDADLPRRGSFHHQGTQVVTAGRARSVAQAEARRRAAAAAATAEATASAPPDAATPNTSATTEQPLRSPTPRAAPRPATGRDAHVHVVPSRPAPWPTIGQRLLYSLIGWIPLAALIALATTDTFGDLVASGLAAVVLGILVLIPRVAYVTAIAGACVLLIGGLLVGALALAGGGLSTAASGLTTALVGFVIVGYAATAAVLFLGPASLRPWSVR